MSPPSPEQKSPERRCAGCGVTDTEYRSEQGSSLGILSYQFQHADGSMIVGSLYLCQECAITSPYARVIHREE